MSLAELSIVSWIAIAVIVAAIGVGWSKKFLATGALVVGNVIVFGLTALGPKVRFIHAPTGQPFTSPVIHQELALESVRLWNLEPLGLLQLLTSMFVHADFFHILGNVIILLAFALHFEERIGARPFLIMYLLSGFAGALAEVLWAAAADGNYTLRLMGASGAVFGIIGAFAGAFPRLVLPLPLPIGFILIFVRMKVITAAMVFGGYQVFYLIFLSPFSNTAFMAHIGGLAAGVVLAFTYVRAKKGEVGAKEAIYIDMQALEPFAQDSPSKNALRQMRVARDEPEVFHAWLEKYFRDARCIQCGNPIAPHKKGEVVCTQGHRFDVRQKGPIHPV